MIEGGRVRAHNSNINVLERVISEELNRYKSRGKHEETQITIHKIPQFVRTSHKDHYEPWVVSIGPFYHGTPGLSRIEKPKWHCLRYILKLNRERRLEEYLDAVATVEKEAQRFYREKITMKRHKFLQMLLLDGCFLLVSLYGTTDILKQFLEGSDEAPQAQDDESRSDDHRTNKRGPRGDNLEMKRAVRSSLHELQKTELNPDKYMIDFNMHGSYNDVFQDLLLLENQIPFFVVKKIFGVLVGREEPNPPFLVHVLDFMEQDMLQEYPIAIRESERPRDFHHLLHLCHMYFRASKKKPDKSHRTSHCFSGFNYFRRSPRHRVDEQTASVDQQPMRWRRLEEYYEAGVKFKAKEFDENNPHSLLDVSFRNGVVEIPYISIEETTGCLFRNLIALEQTCPEYGNDFTAYIIFLSQLVCTKADVEVLVNRDMICHTLNGDEVVSTFFPDLSTNVIFDFNSDYYLKEMCGEMEAYYQSRQHRWMAWLWHNKFRNPWMGILRLSSLIVFISTIVTTVFTVMVFVKPKDVELVTMLN